MLETVEYMVSKPKSPSKIKFRHGQIHRSGNKSFISYKSNFSLYSQNFFKIRHHKNIQSKLFITCSVYANTEWNGTKCSLAMCREKLLLGAELYTTNFNNLCIWHTDSIDWIDV